MVVRGKGFSFLYLQVFGFLEGKGGSRVWNKWVGVIFSDFKVESLKNLNGFIKIYYKVYLFI